MKTAKSLYLRLANMIDFSESFKIDLRSLALVRILTAIILLSDLVTRLPDVALFYGDGSALPSSEMSTFWMGAWGWSVHLLFGGPPSWVTFVFFIQIIFAFSLLLGFWTRTSSIVSWLLVVSLHNANPLILLGGDFLLRQTLFAGMFVPWGEFFSFDSSRLKTHNRISITSVWSAVFLIQIAFMYYFASLYKNSIEWNTDGSAFYYILSIDQYVTPLGHFLLQFPGTLRFLTLGVVQFQHLVVFLLFIPFFNRYIRTATAATLMLMHLCFGVGTHLGIFSWISMTALVAFMPDLVWDTLVEKLTRGSARWKSFAERIRKPALGSALSQKSAGVIAALGIIYICYLFIWQTAGFIPSLKNTSWWDSWSLPAKVFRLEQHWNLFAPRPFTDDGWDIVEGHLSDGRVVDIFRNGEALSFEKPADIYALYGLSHRRQYTLELRKAYNERYRTPYLRHLCNSWNAGHTGADELESVVHIFMKEETPPPGHVQTPITPMTLSSFTCETL